MDGSIRKNILILEPEHDTAMLFARALESRKDCKCYFAADEAEAVALIKDIPFRILLLDMSAVMSNDFALLKRIRRMAPAGLIVPTAHLHQKNAVDRALALGAGGHVFKPIKLESFRKKMEEFYSTLA